MTLYKIILIATYTLTALLCFGQSSLTDTTFYFTFGHNTLPLTGHSVAYIHQIKFYSDSTVTYEQIKHRYPHGGSYSKSDQVDTVILKGKYVYDAKKKIVDLHFSNDTLVFPISGVYKHQKGNLKCQNNNNDWFKRKIMFSINHCEKCRAGKYKFKIMRGRLKNGQKNGSGFVICNAIKNENYCQQKINCIERNYIYERFGL